MAGDHAVAGDDLFVHPEIGAAMRDELVDFLERSGVEEPLHALARGELALLVLFAQPLLAAAKIGAAFEVLQFLDGIHRFTIASFVRSFVCS